MNKLLKALTDLAEQHNLSITNLSIQEIGNKTVTNVEFEFDNLKLTDMKMAPGFKGRLDELEKIYQVD